MDPITKGLTSKSQHLIVHCGSFGYDPTDLHQFVGVLSAQAPDLVLMSLGRFHDSFIWFTFFILLAQLKQTKEKYQTW